VTNESLIHTLLDTVQKQLGPQMRREVQRYDGQDADDDVRAGAD
jgi:hypothetical protein